ncbi:hypothetical protein [Burkholderia cepacia]|uniref:hypothetical protein n=1 Tax=Burkholderia cepacia TaxID=292 RepID=UPI002AB7659C|nr:hypothetical protein [Burkholderia cepacia]
MAWARHAFGRIRGLARYFGIVPTVPARNWQRVTGSGGMTVADAAASRAAFKADRALHAFDPGDDVALDVDLVIASDRARSTHTECVIDLLKQII